MKKYLEIKTDYEPKITGKRDGDSAVKQKFETKEKEDEFEDFFYDIYENRSKISLENFQIFDIQLDAPITYIPKTKSIKKLDFMSYGRYQFGLDYLVSERVITILEKYKLPAVYHKLPAQIETFEEKYYLIGFPMISDEECDFDIINRTDGCFFAEEIIKEFEKEQITGYKIGKKGNVPNVLLK
ncbi:hypothetical protein [Capnocytophaga canimorsus]|uniref:hypothetical protein n=1 Tax=Capnocytophaga canimorsus TaxID=28188 RepID=UPI0015620098|nr:hypothetical protein [Capnocytophaga canimorsus]GIM57753.1 hypothetical protein CAPN006_21450 [Capnocytophaga canimorsus]